MLSSIMSGVAMGVSIVALINSIRALKKMEEFHKKIEEFHEYHCDLHKHYVTDLEGEIMKTEIRCIKRDLDKLTDKKGE